MPGDDPLSPQVAQLAKDRLAHLIRHVARGLTRSLQIRLAEHDIQFGHWVFLRILWDENGLTQKDLSERASLMEPTTHTALAKLESLGFVERKHPAGNKRKRVVSLTPAGRALRATLEPLAEEVNDLAVTGIDAPDLEVLRPALLTMAHNLALDEQEADARGRRVPATRSLAG